MMEGDVNWLRYQQQPNIAGAYMAGQRAVHQNQLISTRNELGQQQVQQNQEAIQRRNIFDKAVQTGNWDAANKAEPDLFSKYVTNMSKMTSAQKQQTAIVAEQRFRRTAAALHSPHPVAAMRRVVASLQPLFPNTPADSIKTLADAKHVATEALYGAATTSEVLRQQEFNARNQTEEERIQADNNLEKARVEHANRPRIITVNTPQGVMSVNLDTNQATPITDESGNPVHEYKKPDLIEAMTRWHMEANQKFGGKSKEAQQKRTQYVDQKFNEWEKVNSQSESASGAPDTVSVKGQRYKVHTTSDGTRYITINGTDYKVGG